MPDIAIKIEDLGKKYIIGHQSDEKHSTLRDLVTSNFKNMIRRSKHVLSGDKLIEGDLTEEFWALRHMNLEIRQGDQLAVIGNNGAGKSTLLKILGRIVEPTEGKVTITGRIASLLEVGTGFHGELSGRENIYLNGSIMGMKRSEINRKFDEIVEFAEVSQFLDTPVKRYSSGMYLRLAFAIAAHLDPEILLIDEVLAVGDFRFQQKCLGKMEDIAKNEGRTIIFVSHSMGIVSQLCKQAVFLNSGRVNEYGDVRKVINHYLNHDSRAFGYSSDGRNKEVYISSVELKNDAGSMVDSFQFDEHINLHIGVKYNQFVPSLKIGLMLQNKTGEALTTIVEELTDVTRLDTGKELLYKVRLDKNVVAPNTYAFCVALFETVNIVYDWVEMVCPFKVIDSGTKMSAYEGLNFGSYFFMNYEFRKDS
jgi:lipopolysaccharide transport system ATP-binding protein